MAASIKGSELSDKRYVRSCLRHFNIADSTLPFMIMHGEKQTRFLQHEAQYARHGEGFAMKGQKRKSRSVCESVWPSGKALGWYAERPRFDPLWLSFLFKKCCLWTPSCDFAHTINDTLKWLTELPTLIQNHTGGDSVTSGC